MRVRRRKNLTLFISEIGSKDSIKNIKRGSKEAQKRLKRRSSKEAQKRLQKRLKEALKWL